MFQALLDELVQELDEAKETLAEVSSPVPLKVDEAHAQVEKAKVCCC